MLGTDHDGPQSVLPQDGRIERQRLDHRARLEVVGGVVAKRDTAFQVDAAEIDVGASCWLCTYVELAQLIKQILLARKGNVVLESEIEAVAEIQPHAAAEIPFLPPVEKQALLPVKRRGWRRRYQQLVPLL